MRINSKPTTERQKARNVLGWVGCSPAPLTIYEIEQALLVSDDPQRRARISSRLDVVRLCGPIIEVVDDYVQFVHFTVKESVEISHSS